MRIDRIFRKNNGKVFTTILLRHAYRDNGKVRHKTLLNLTGYADEDIDAMEFALKNKKNLKKLEDILHRKFITRYSIGAIYLLYQLSKQLGIQQVLGNSQEGKIILWEVLSRLIQPTSKLGSVRLAKQHAILEIANMEPFSENDVYNSLIWLNERQSIIEKKLYERREKKVEELFLYDVTSSYLEGTQNELAEFGYNRDKKKGKMQIVIGLLTDRDGIPISVQVYEGNTQDVNTLGDQIEKTCNLFEIKNVIFVGDKGMIKTEGQKQINKLQYNYITGITKPQIESLLKQDVIQMSLFDNDIHEVETDDGIRYVLRRNPLRAGEMEYSRQDRLKCLIKFVQETNTYLREHFKADTQKAFKRVEEKAQKLKINKWLTISVTEREIIVNQNDEVLAQISKLDGCYMLKTDIKKDHLGAIVIHQRYKDLIKVEQAFKDSKTQYLEVRPLFLRKQEQTRAHVFIVMLSYIINLYLENAWKSMDMKVKEGLDKLSHICILQTTEDDKTITLVADPDEEASKLLKLTNTILPKSVKLREKDVYTTVKLQDQRKK